MMKLFAHKTIKKLNNKGLKHFMEWNEACKVVSQFFGCEESKSVGFRIICIM